MSKKQNTKKLEEEKTADFKEENYGSKKSRSRRASNSKPTSKNFFNDPAFYFTDAEFMKQITNTSFNQFTGVPFSLNSNTITNANNVEIPSIMKVSMNPTIGYVPKMFARNYGINLAAFKFYTQLSSINGKTTLYAPYDISTLILAFGNLLAYKSFIERCFGLAFLANKRNRAVPIRLIESLNIDYDDLVSNLDIYRGEYNTIISLLSSIPIPSNVAYFSKCADMFSHVYVDDESAMAQLIINVPKHVWEIHEMTSMKGTELKAVDVSSLATLGSHIDQFMKMTQLMLNSSTLNTIYSDIINLKNKRDVPLWTMSIVPDGYAIMPEYNETFLNTLHNARIIGDPMKVGDVPATLTSSHDWSDGLNITPDPNTNCLWQHMCFQRRGGFDADCILDFDHENPSMEEILEATRYMSACTSVPNTNTSDTNTYYDASTPDWYVSVVEIYNSSSRVVNMYSAGANTNNLVSDNLTKFKSGPIYYIVDQSNIYRGMIGDLDYFTTLPREYINRVNNAAMLSLFEVR